VIALHALVDNKAENTRTEQQEAKKNEAAATTNGKDKKEDAGKSGEATKDQ